MTGALALAAGVLLAWLGIWRPARRALRRAAGGRRWPLPAAETILWLTGGLAVLWWLLGSPLRHG